MAGSRLSMHVRSACAKNLAMIGLTKLTAALSRQRSVFLAKRGSNAMLEGRCLCLASTSCWPSPYRMRTKCTVWVAGYDVGLRGLPVSEVSARESAF